MFALLLVATFTIATAASFAVVRLFDRPLAGIIQRLVPDELAVAWQRYVLFGVYLIGINGGVRIWQFEKYVLPGRAAPEPLLLTVDRWALEVYRTLMGTLGSVAKVLLIFFLVALGAYLMLRIREATSETPASAPLRTSRA